MRRVVVVGAGFAGLSCVKALRHAPVEITLVDRHNFHTFQPLLYQVATAGLGADDIAHSVRGIFHDQHNVTFLLGSVSGIDLDGRRILVEGAPAVEYDLCVLAAGAATATFGVAGVEDSALALKTLPEALEVRNHVLRQFELADGDPALIDRGALTIVVIGGGPTGVELAGALTELFDNVFARDFPRLDMTRARVVLLEATDRLLGQFSTSSAAYALAKLKAMGVDVRLGTAVDRVTNTAVHLASGDVISTRTAIWVAGVQAAPLAALLGVERGRAGRVMVDNHLQLAGHPEVFVIGDLAAAPDRHDGVLPQLAPIAIQQGKYVARIIARQARGSAAPHRRAFRYVDKGTMATIGRNAAVAELPGRIRIRGFVAWVTWLFLHLMYLVGFRNRVNVFVNWAWNYVTYDRGARLIITAGRDEEPNR